MELNILTIWNNAKKIIHTGLKSKFSKINIYFKFYICTLEIEKKINNKI